MALGVKDRVNMLGASGEGFSAQTIAAIIGSSVSDVISVLTSPAAAPADPFTAGAIPLTQKGVASGVGTLDSGGHQPLSELSPSVAVVSSPAAFTKPVTIAPTAGADVPLVLTAAGTGDIVRLNNASGLQLVFNRTGGPGVTQAGQIIFYGANAPTGSGNPAGRAWYIAVDTAAPTSQRDLAIGKFLADGTASDADGFYISNGGASPASIGAGIVVPDGTFRFQVASSGLDVSQGGIYIRHTTNQTGDMLALDSTASSKAWRFKASGETVLRSVDTTRAAADFATFGNTTLQSATIAFTSEDVGRFITSGNGIPAGTYILSVQSGTSATMSLPATTSNSGLNLTLYGRVFQVRSTGDVPYMTVMMTSMQTVRFGVNVGIGPGCGSPASTTATLQLAQTGATDSVIQMNTTNNGQLTITAKGATPAAVIQTTNNSDLVFGSNLTTRLTVNKTGGLTLADANDIAVGTTTGTKIGTVGGAAGQKVAFLGATPVVQQLLATGASHTVDDVIAVLQTFGLVRQS